VCVILFIFGAFCAIWAQDTGHNAWLWFFMGVFFNVITVLVLLSLNSSERQIEREREGKF
jgi:threonine/homoserine/homoserine lactone efflux protein